MTQPTQVSYSVSHKNGRLYLRKTRITNPKSYDVGTSSLTLVADLSSSFVENYVKKIEAMVVEKVLEARDDAEVQQARSLLNMEVYRVLLQEWNRRRAALLSKAMETPPEKRGLFGEGDDASV